MSAATSLKDRTTHAQTSHCLATLYRARRRRPDFAGTVRQVAAIGYAGVELAGYGGMSVRDLQSPIG